jgi:hypothetical protein
MRCDDVLSVALGLALVLARPAPLLLLTNCRCGSAIRTPATRSWLISWAFAPPTPRCIQPSGQATTTWHAFGRPQKQEERRRSGARREGIARNGKLVKILLLAAGP